MRGKKVENSGINLDNRRQNSILQQLVAHEWIWGNLPEFSSWLILSLPHSFYLNQKDLRSLKERLNNTINPLRKKKKNRIISADTHETTRFLTQRIRNREGKQKILKAKQNIDRKKKMFLFRFHLNNNLASCGVDAAK